MLKSLHSAALVIAAGIFGVVTATHAEEPRKIAFVDTGNTGRSVSAEALANVIIKQKGVKIAVISRAVDMDPFDVSPEANAVKLLRDRNIDVSQHLSVQLTPGDVKHADLILTMSAKHKDKVHTLSEYATGTYTEVVDAWGKPMDAYLAVFKQLDVYVPAALEKSNPPK